MRKYLSDLADQLLGLDRLASVQELIQDHTTNQQETNRDHAAYFKVGGGLIRSGKRGGTASRHFLHF